MFTYDRLHTSDSYTTPENAAAGDSYETAFLDNGTLKTLTTPEGVVTTFNQDAGVSGYLDEAETEPATFIKGRMDNIDLPGTEGTISVAYVSDGENKLSSIELDRDEDASWDEKVTFTYDGNLAESVAFAGTLNQTISNTYRDNDLAVVSTTYAGVTKNFTYDDDGLLLTAGSFTINREASVGVANDTGRVNYVTDSTFKVIPSYTMFAEVDALDYQISTVSKSDWALTLNDFGEITAKVDTVNGMDQSFTYFYDNLGQLDTVKNAAATVTLEAYTYDENGNRLTSDVGGVTREKTEFSSPQSTKKNCT